MSTRVLEVEDLRVRFATPRGPVVAVDGVSFTLERGETLGIVGESGSGKSVTSLALLGLLDPRTATVSARRLALAGRDARAFGDREWRAVRGREIARVFQDPGTALNPFLTVERQLSEVLELHEGATRAAARPRVVDALAEVGIADPAARAAAFPHELSGGMRQRVMIAMALLCRPQVLIADEPTTALDVTVQAQILELFGAVQRRHGTAIVLVSHSLGVVARVCDRVQVMYAGRVVESATAAELFRAPRHPYTRGLLASVPRLAADPRARLASIPGQPPTPVSERRGCAFAPRCDLAEERCRSETPELLDAGGSRAACFLARTEALPR